MKVKPTSLPVSPGSTDERDEVPGDGIGTTCISDAELRRLDRTAALKLDVDIKLRWFKIRQVMHRELRRVTNDLMELLSPSNDVSVLLLVGMTGIGKTTLADNLSRVMGEMHYAECDPSEVPIIYIKAPANGETSHSWRSTYSRILEAAHEPLIGAKVLTVTVDNIMSQPRGKDGRTVDELRRAVEKMLHYRKVRFIIIDEAQHYVRTRRSGGANSHEGSSADTPTLDTLKSIASVAQTKLLLLAPHEFVERAIEYAQLARRAEIVHYRRYGQAIPADKTEFQRALAVMLGQWPFEEVPNLGLYADEVMKSTLGSIGLLKDALLKLAILQSKSADHSFQTAMLAKAFKSPRALEVIDDEAVRGEEALRGATYGESAFAALMPAEV